jgi:hypothetical protein
MLEKNRSDDVEKIMIKKKSDVETMHKMIMKQ